MENQIKLFNRWSYDDINIEDMGLKTYINLSPAIFPRSFGRSSSTRFHKTNINIVERLINKIAVSGHKGKKHYITSKRNSGNFITAVSLVKNAFEMIENNTKQNPIQVLVDAIEAAAPREEVTSIEYGGARYPKAVECAPQRRIDIVLRYLVQGAHQKSFNKRTSFSKALSDEIVNASLYSQNALAISRKHDSEKQADSSR